MSSEKFEFPDALISAATNGYIIAESKGIKGIMPGDALWATLEENRWDPHKMLESQSGRQAFNVMRRFIAQRIEELKAVDPKE